MLKRSVSWMEGQRNIGLKAMRIILQGAQTDEVVGPIFLIFDMAVEHGGIRFKTKIVGRAGRLQPLVAIDLVIANHAAHALIENLGSTARKRIEPSIFELLQRLSDGELGPLGQKSNLHHGERLDMDLGKPLLQSRDQIE